MVFLGRVVTAIENITCTGLRRRKQLACFHTSHDRWKATVISGRQVANVIQEQLKNEVCRMVMEGCRPPQLTTIVVGDDYVSHLYVKQKTIGAKSVGISTKAVFLDQTVSERELINLIKSLNKNSEVNAILVQLPLPNHISERKVSNSIAPTKDVDGFNSENIGRFCLNMSTVIPCTALAVREIIAQTGIATKGKHAVICGRSKNVGMPIGMILHADGEGDKFGLDATTTICHRFTPPEELRRLTRSADILVAAAGVPMLIQPDMVKEGACVIDVGISRQLDPSSGKSKILGDVDFKGVQDVAAFITPVPGGVGPLTVAMLLRNTVKIAKEQQRIMNL